MSEHVANMISSDRCGSGCPASLPRAIILVGLAVVCLACEPPAPTACDGLEDRRYGITREEYAPCAREMMTALDTLQRQLQRVVLRADSLVWPEARKTYRHLRLLRNRVGFVADAWRELRAQSPGPYIERWPDGSMRAFNLHLGNAFAQYMSAVNRPNRANLQEGSRHHAYARQAYARIR
jgi:hypothetical protein